MTELPKPSRSTALATPERVRQGRAARIDSLAPCVPDRFLTARDVADRLGLHVKTALRYVRVAGLPACRLPGGDLRFAWPEVSEWLGRRKEARR